MSIFSVLTPFIVGIYWMNWILFGVLLMRKLDHVKTYHFWYRMMLLVLVNITILTYPSLGSNLWSVIIFPYAASYLSGLIYFVIKGTY